MAYKEYSKKPRGKERSNYRKSSGFEVVILAGGTGSRLKNLLTDRPKILAEIGGKPFLDILIDQLWEQEVSRIILCLGYLKEKIITYIKSRTLEDERFGKLDFVIEERPLGTGGAVKNALEAIKSNHFFLMNGDSIWKGLDLRDIYDFHIEKDSAVSIALCPKTNAHEYGRVSLGDKSRIVQFAEKNKLPGAGLVSAGVYLIKKEALSHIPQGEKLSLEYDILPELVKNGVCYGLEIDGDFLDIGTPDRFQMAEEFLNKL